MTARSDSPRMLAAKAEIFKALGHPARLRMVQALSLGERCVCELVEMVPGSQATTSRHLDVLLRAGLVSRRRKGVWMIYSLEMPCLLRAMPCVTEAIRRRIERASAVLER
jgi:DNA-binding transcriptional ArsR family regulator